MYKKAVELTPNNIFAFISLAGAYGMMGREEEAKSAVYKVLQINPKYSLEYFRKVSIAYDKDAFVDVLRKSGLPEHPPLPLPDKPRRR